MILAAGQGSRMRELTKNTPKPLLKVNGQALIEYRINAYKNAGIRNIVINVSLENHGQQIINYLGNGERYGVTLKYSIEEKTLGTGGGIVNALPLFDSAEKFWVCGADVWTDFSFTNSRNHHCERIEAIQQKNLAHLILVPNPDHNTRGDFGLEKGLLLNEPRTYTFSGVVLYHRDLFLNAPAGNFHVIDLVRKAIEEKRVTGELHSGVWVDVGTPERLATLQA
jgi:MurNAc alpha-1-phosphate uridylyltransferase